MDYFSEFTDSSVQEMHGWLKMYLGTKCIYVHG